MAVSKGCVILLSDEIRQSIEESVLCWLATVDAEGMPNCSPKEMFAAYGADELLIAHIASPHSVRNIAQNPQVCVSFVHVLKQKGYKLKGTAVYVPPTHNDYADLFAVFAPLVGDVFPVKGIIRIKITQANPIIAPSYYLVPGTTEASQISAAKKTYGMSS